MVQLLRTLVPGFEEPLMERLRKQAFSAAVLSRGDPPRKDVRLWYDINSFGSGFWSAFSNFTGSRWRLITTSFTSQELRIPTKVELSEPRFCRLTYSGMYEAASSFSLARSEPSHYSFSGWAREMKITVVIAAYNEAENIGPLTERLVRTLDTLTGSSWNLIYVIEGTDGTVGIARAFAVTRPEIEILYKEQPSGLGRAFRRGFDAIPPDADFVVTMDADQNHQPEEIPRLLAVAQETVADIVVGSRRVSGSEVAGMPLWKSAVSRLVNHVMRMMMGVRVNDMTSGFRVYRASALRQIRFDRSDFAFLPEILIHSAAQRYKIVETPIRFVFRESGESKMRIPATGLSYVKLFAKHFLASIFSVLNE